ncbi:uncharacterized protein C17orf80 homolog [Apus apus]|uniref:uncharacterized protein C17orf80 homolog n=1 Tax=Apus apus TaxID=8895 RepID=UPI0021F85972|nr:uncharacterized protein C17orf80 homolog [Apus apus]
MRNERCGPATPPAVTECAAARRAAHARGGGAGMAGRERCPHCLRPFQRLRAHLPHCRAAPRPAPGPGRDSGHPAPGSGAGSDGAGAAAGPRAGAESGGQPPGSGHGLPRQAAPAGGEAARKGKKAAQGGGSGPGARRRPEGPREERRAEPSEQDVATALDLLPEEVRGIPEKLSNGVEVVIEKHRARVLREKSGSRSRGSPAGTPRTPAGTPGSPAGTPRTPAGTPRTPAGTPGSPAGTRGSGAGEAPGGARGAAPARPGLRDGTIVPEIPPAGTRGLGAAENAAAGSKGGKGRIKAAKTAAREAEAAGRDSPGGLALQEGAEPALREEKQMHPGVGVECKASLSALHTKNLHLPVSEGFRDHHKGTAKNYLSSTEKPGEREQQMAAVSEPILQGRRDTELAQHQLLLPTSKIQPVCPSQASGRSTPAGATSLEWFPDLYPNYHRLSIFPGKPFQEETGITMKTPRGDFSEGQQGPLRERRLLDVQLAELPAWLGTRDLSPQGLLGGVQKAWSSYYNKYINVRKGGPAGLSMLLAGYCLLSYSWNYQHIKQHRWRKYH